MTAHGWSRDLATKINAGIRLADDLAISIPTVAVILGVDERTVRKAIELGQIRAFQCAEKTLVPTYPLRRLLGMTDAELCGDPREDIDEDAEVAEIEAITGNPPGTVLAMARELAADLAASFPPGYMEQQISFYGEDGQS